MASNSITLTKKIRKKSANAHGKTQSFKAEAKNFFVKPLKKDQILNERSVLFYGKLLLNGCNGIQILPHPFIGHCRYVAHDVLGIGSTL